MTSPAGDKVTFVNLETKKSSSVRLSDSKETPLQVTPIWGPNAAALMLKGPTITRIAAASDLNGTWHTQDLREPVKGQAMPIVGPGVVAYGLGRFIYAFSAEAQRWDVVELPKGVHGTPIVRANSVTVEVPGHIYTFGGRDREVERPQHPRPDRDRRGPGRAQEVSQRLSHRSRVPALQVRQELLDLSDSGLVHPGSVS